MLRFAVPVGAVLPLILLMAGTGLAGPTHVEGGLYPDLRAANPHHFTVQNNQQREFLRFSNMVANTGEGDLNTHRKLLHLAAAGVRRCPPVESRSGPVGQVGVFARFRPIFQGFPYRTRGR